MSTGYAPEDFEVFDSMLSRALIAGRTACITIKSRSMDPLIKLGAKVELRHVPLENLQAGDIIVYQGGGAWIAHRLMNADNSALVCRGDRTERYDAPVPPTAYRGKVIRISNPSNVLNLEDRHAWLFERPRYLAARLRLKANLFIHRLCGSFLKRRNARWARQTWKTAVMLTLAILKIIGRPVFGAQTLYVRRTAATGAVVPGATDIDITVIFEDANPSEHLSRLRRAGRRHRLLKLFLPLIQHAEFLYQKEFELFQRSMLFEAGEVSGWQLLAGREFRSPAPAPFLPTAEACLIKLQSFLARHREMCGKHENGSIGRLHYEYYRTRLERNLSEFTVSYGAELRAALESDSGPRLTSVLQLLDDPRLLFGASGPGICSRSMRELDSFFFRRPANSSHAAALVLYMNFTASSGSPTMLAVANQGPPVEIRMDSADACMKFAAAKEAIFHG